MSNAPPRPVSDGDSDGDAGDDKRSFKHQVGREAREKTELAEANFDLQLKLQAVTKERDDALKIGAAFRRATKDGFYDFGDGDGDEPSDYDDQSVAMERLRESHVVEIAGLAEELEEAREAATRAKGRSRICEKKLGKVEKERDGLLVERDTLTGDLLRERATVDDMESEVLASKVTVRSALEEIEDLRSKAQSRESKLKLTTEGLTIQLAAMEVGLREVRERADRLQNEGRSWKNKATEAETRVQRVARDTAEGQKAREAGSAAAAVNMADMGRLQSELNALQLRHDGLLAESKARKEAGRESALSPLGVGNENAGLSVPGFELYARLLKKIRGKGDLIVTGEGPVKEWRTIVLGEMNDSLVMLYWQVEKLENDRKMFVEKYCKVLMQNKRKGRRESSTRMVLEETRLVN